MANEISFFSFDQKEVMFDIVSDILAKNINTLLRSNLKCNVLLSGGSTPKPIYKSLKQKIVNIEKVNFALVDERFVANDNDNSNEKMIRETLGVKSNITGMVFDISSKRENLNEVRTIYKPFMISTDITILGMGTDGHTASIFPFDESSENVRNSRERTIFNTTSPVFPTDRITCSTAMICSSKEIYLIVTGKEKKEILFSLDQSLPIHDVILQRPDIQIYYAD